MQNPFVNHGMEESPGEARARFHSELFERVRSEAQASSETDTPVKKPHPVPEEEREELLETMAVWEQSIWSSVDKTAEVRKSVGGEQDPT